MRKLNTISISPTQGISGKLQKPFTPGRHLRSRSMNVEADVSIKNNDIAPVTLSAAQALDICTKLFGSIDMRLGNGKAVEIVDNKLTFADFRSQAIGISGRDAVRFNGVDLAVYSAGSAAAVVIAAGATASIHITLIRYFHPERLGPRGKEFCPFNSQLEEMNLEIVRGAAFATATLQQIGTADGSVYLDDFDAEAEAGWAPVIRLHKDDTGGLKQNGPDNCGALVMVWEESAAGAATALRTVSLTRGKDLPIHENVEAPDVVRESSERVPIGAYDLNNVGGAAGLGATVLYQLPPLADLEDLRTGRDWQLSQAQLLVAQMMSRWLYAPAMSDVYFATIVKPQFQGEKDPARALLMAAVVRGEKLPGHISGVLSLAAVEPSSPKANNNDVHVVTRQGATLVPSPVLDGLAKGLDKYGKASLAAERAKSVAGGRSPERPNSTGTVNAAVLKERSGA